MDNNLSYANAIVFVARQLFENGFVLLMDDWLIKSPITVNIQTQTCTVSDSIYGIKLKDFKEGNTTKVVDDIKKKFEESLFYVEKQVFESDSLNFFNVLGLKDEFLYEVNEICLHADQVFELLYEEVSKLSLRNNYVKLYFGSKQMRRKV